MHMLIYKIYPEIEYILYLDTHILCICTTLEDPLQVGYSSIVFTGQSSFHNLLAYCFM